MQRTGQALLEVAIFGAIIIMLLGVLISYGLRYNYQQKTMQQAFRKALSRVVVQPGVSASDVVVSDEHVPNPSDTFGVGSVTPFTGSAGGISRDYLGDPPERYTIAPTVVININGEERTYTTAGFRDETNVPEPGLGRYKEVYGSGSVEDRGEGECLEFGDIIDPNTGEPGTECLQPTKNIRIIDPCAGQIIDYGTAVKQCRMTVDSAACLKECNRSHYSDATTTNCDSICNQSMNVPWYCETAECGLNACNLGATHIYNFVKLEQLFGNGGIKAIGLQQDYKQNTLTNNTLRKTEDTSGITTMDSIDWKTQTKRKIITNTGSTSGVPNIEEVTSEVSQKSSGSRTTNW
ncbi:MAG: hypothetical protein L6308_03310 [Candidatus Omnitrophica bacterium]|nr:hypothetical protein [Candidatus Omnitrophota bacterium]